jgi:hypothetical protein
MRGGGPTAHPASTQQILELRDKRPDLDGDSKTVGMTVSGAWSTYQRARPPKPPTWGRWQKVLADALDHNLAIASERLWLIISGELPLALSSTPRGGQPTFRRPWPCPQEVILKVARDSIMRCGLRSAATATSAR